MTSASPCIQSLFVANFNLAGSILANCQARIGFHTARRRPRPTFQPRFDCRFWAGGGAFRITQPDGIRRFAWRFVSALRWFTTFRKPTTR